MASYYTFLHPPYNKKTMWRACCTRAFTTSLHGELQSSVCFAASLEEGVEGGVGCTLVLEDPGREEDAGVGVSTPERAVRDLQQKAHSVNTIFRRARTRKSPHFINRMPLRKGARTSSTAVKAGDGDKGRGGMGEGAKKAGSSE